MLGVGKKIKCSNSNKTTITNVLNIDIFDALYQTRNVLTNAPNKFMFGHAKGTPNFTQSTIQLNYNLYQYILYLYNKLQQI